MYVYCNFHCSPAKKHGSDPPFLGLVTPLAGWLMCRNKVIIIKLHEGHLVFFTPKMKSL